MACEYKNKLRMSGMAVFGFAVLVCFAIYLTLIILFIIFRGGEEFSYPGLKVLVISIVVLFAVWYGIYFLMPFNLSFK